MARTAYEKGRLQVSAKPTIGMLDRALADEEKLAFIFREVKKLSKEADKIKRRIFYGARKPQLCQDKDSIEGLRTLHGILGILTELGEMYKVSKDGHLETCDNMLEELGDLRFYLGELADAGGFTMKDIEKSNLDKLEARYPGLQFTPKKAKNRDLKKEKQAINGSEASPPQIVTETAAD